MTRAGTEVERNEIVGAVLEEFRGLSAMPHGSGNERAAGAYLMERLRRLALAPVMDGAGNVMADVPASPGHEDRPLLILQGHMDMVCAVRPDSGFDPKRDAPHVRVDGGLLHTDGTSSLGADNDLGNAVVLALLERGAVHGPLRILFTTGEEVGLKGAHQVDPAWLSGAWGLLNTDGFHLGRAIVGSAGGRRETYARPLERVPARGTMGWRISITGGTGGHSGDDIHKGRLNAVRALAGFLWKLWRELPFQIGDLAGGTAHNAIAAGASCRLVTGDEGAAVLPGAVEALRTELVGRYGETDPHARVELEPVPLPETVWAQEAARDTCALLTTLFHGVYEAHPRFPDVVGASSNVAKVWEREGQVEVLAFTRCATYGEEKALFAQHDGAAADRGFRLAKEERYPSWPGDPDSRLAALLAEGFRETSDRTVDVTAVHVGLELSVLGAKAPGMVMLSTGPEILDAHSVDERAPLEGLPDYAAALAYVLERV
ncbi:M20/M25/M40 family metallo-hydrolase [Pseudoflavonifractor sp. MSJ-37]|uniref:M20/M25/M40 family metallo-hydrolase n=1 Tax=Pseudoflavonifractor sp. MSJ-37 TaxID=2841531 RepID=UPI001C106275|nr:M20/M25/M40 family metallo-hydrolase [Pseudoflavonifractor sp. MSJ-37]MBU5436080.1 M20/M25/M40 family metallo-hydrolase [Pseudoflavonifractor sp. MSJ-37]